MSVIPASWGGWQEDQDGEILSFFLKKETSCNRLYRQEGGREGNIEHATLPSLRNAELNANINCNVFINKITLNITYNTLNNSLSSVK